MADTYEPIQITKNYLYIESEKTVYVEVNITCKLNQGENLVLNNNPNLVLAESPNLGHETSVNFRVIKEDRDTPYTKEVLIPLLRCVEKTDNIRDLIKKDMIAKGGIVEYTIYSQVKKLDVSYGKKTTSTISGDALINKRPTFITPPE